MTYRKKFSHRALLLGGILAAYSCQVPQQKQVQSSTTNTGVDKFAEHIRTTPFQTPEQERKGFTLPEGFEISLFASEPQIGKPMNIEFDDQGRLWVTQSSEYPLAADSEHGKDKITILEDRNGDGKADKFTEFKTGLNIPIGILPVSDGAVAFSIPNVYHYKDTNKDDKADETKKLLGPFGYNDTHGMVNNLVRGYDGWIHSSHGFSNSSRIAGADGDSLFMNSGNTFRFKLDGSRAEQTTFGRVNPFGFAFDERGYLYSIDCHSKPIYQLIPYADYPHFGKVPTGIGFGPEMTSYELGSTALAGLVYYTGEQFPEKYKNNFFIGDVVTSKISRNSVSFKGTTPIAKFEENFLTSDDPWFRPVDVKVGPDGAIYIADFYNRIIGHYEVSLDHPGRDRLSGRIWKITYKGNKTKPVKAGNTLEALISQLSTPQLTTRMRIADKIEDVYGQKAVAPLLKTINEEQTPWQAKIQSLWLLHRLNELPDDLLMRYAKEANETLQIHALRIIAEQPTITTTKADLLLQAIKHKNPFIQRAATEALYRHPNISALQPLTKLYYETNPEDNHLTHSTLHTIRKILATGSNLTAANKLPWTELDRDLITRAIIDLPSQEAGMAVYERCLLGKVPAVFIHNHLEYAARYASPSQIDQLVEVVQKQYAKDEMATMSMYQSLAKGLHQSAKPLTPKLDDLNNKAALTILKKYSSEPFQKLHQLPGHEREQLLHSIRLAGQKKLSGGPELLRKVLPDGAPFDIQREALFALLAYSPTDYSPEFRTLFNDIKTYPVYKEILAIALAHDPHPENIASLANGLSGATKAVQLRIADGLSAHKVSIDALLTAAEQGDVSSVLLQEEAIKKNIKNLASDTEKARYEKIITSGASLEEEKAQIIKEREVGYLKHKPNLAKGKEVFIANCSSCHQINGNGGLIGPQLDGIGNWGSKMLTEKILDPNRNVTEAFKTYTITLHNNEEKVGLYRRTEGETMVFADASGQEFSLLKSSIKNTKASNMTIMPNQFRHIIPEKDFYDLVNYLTTIKQ